MKSREEFISDIPNVSFINDTENENINTEDLMSYIDDDYLFACGDIFTKVWEDDSSVEWGCRNSFMKISLEKDGTESYYGEANMLPNDIDYFE